MKQWFSVWLFVVLGLSLTIAGCSSAAPSSGTSGASAPSSGTSGASAPSSSASSSSPSVTLRLGHNSHEESVTNKAFKNWANTLSQKSGGKLKLEVFPQNQLGTNKELTDQTGIGSLDMSAQGLSAYVDLGVEEGYMAKVPFLFNSLDASISFWQGEDGKAFMKKVEPKGAKVLSVGLNRMPRQMASKNKPLNTPADIKGLKIRAGDTATNSALKVLGAVPTNVALNEMYTAVSQGMVDVVELPLDYIYSYAMYEVAKHLTLTNHTYDLQWLIVNKSKFEGLPQEYQKLITDTIPDLEKENNKGMEADFGDTLNKIKAKGMNVIETDRSKWSAMVPDLVPELEKMWPSTKGYYDKIMKLK